MNKNARFDRANVIEKAMNLYWEKGYHGTSMRNLQVTIDLRPGSIYSAFGSKDNLFKEALNFYAQSAITLLACCLNEASSPLAALKLFIQKIIIDNRSCSPSNMCMIVKSISELTETDNKELLKEAKLHLNNVELKFVDIIEQAIQCGEIDENKDSVVLAGYVQVQIIGLRTYVRVNDDIVMTQKFIDELFLGPPFQ